MFPPCHRVDVLVASLTGSAPRYEWRPRRKALSKQASGALDPGSVLPPNKLGSGFNPEIHHAILPTITLICELVVALDQFVCCKVNAPLMHDLIDARNEIQHALCSIRPIPMPYCLDYALQELCRSVLMCFSDMVIFPIPEKTGLRYRLTTQLCAAMNACEQLDAWLECYEFMLWATMMGAIASTDPSHRNFFEILLHNALSAQFLAWEDLKSCMMHFLWWDFVCEEPGLQAYTAAIMRQPFSS